MSRQHILRGWFSELDLSEWMFKCGVLDTGLTVQWFSILAVGRLAEFYFLSIRISVRVDICDTHFQSGCPKRLSECPRSQGYFRKLSC